jgi:glycosyltransferase involved in cell wall biosynthesis
MQKLSIVIPTYTLTKELEDLALEAIRSYRAYADELIVTEDGGRYSPEIMAKVDTYIYNWQNKGFTSNVNRGWRQATGDFVAIASSDTYLFEGNPRDLMIEGKVTSPEIINQNIDALAGPFFVVPKEIAKERGYLREEMRTYSSDSEYDARVADIFQTVPSVVIYHHQAQTVTAAGVEGGEEMIRDREAYQKIKDDINTNSNN